MGLRINTNTSALAAIRNLGKNDRTQARTLEHLSTGLRINRASDDPSGLVISEQLRSQINSLKQASENTQADTNMIATADAAMEEMSNLLNDIKGAIVFALNTAAASPEQVAAEQTSVDGALLALNRIVNTTRFADGGLLNGNSGFVTTGVNAAINDLNVRRINFPPGTSPLQVDVTLTANGGGATQGQLTLAAAGANGAIVRIIGPRGSADVTLGAAATVPQVATAINNVRTQTGVYVDNAGLSMFTEEFGTSQRVSFTVLDGSMGGVAAAGTIAGLLPGQTESDAGDNATALINGQTFTGNGRVFNISNDIGEFSFSLASPPGTESKETGLDLATAAGSPYSFTVQRSGMGMQLNTQATGSDHLQIGIGGMDIGALGFERIRNVLRNPTVLDPAGEEKGGRLKTLMTGNANSLTGDLSNASDIVDEAIKQVAGTRAFLGSIAEKVLAPNLNSVEVAVENLSAAESNIRDLNFAEETSAFTKSQILFQTGIASLASANLVPQAVLSLLR